MAVGRPTTVASDLLTPAQMRERREATGLSLRALALRVGMSVAASSGYESGRKPTPDAVARRLSEALDF